MWQIDGRVQKALDILDNQGFEAWLVGGCIRDWLLGREPKDLDIATAARPEQVVQAFKDYRVIATGIKHGTVTVVLEQLLIEITTFRIDGDYSDNRHPQNVIYTQKLIEDLKRRDFTMNALAYHPKRGLIDVFGGQQDIKDKIIRAVGQPCVRFSEDALRILRGIRFAAVLGFAVEPTTSAAMFAECVRLQNISAERILAELQQMLCGKAVRPVLTRYIGIWGVVIPELLRMEGFDQHNPHHDFDVLEHTLRVMENIEPRLHLRLAALLHDIGKPDTFSLDEAGVGHFYGHVQAGVELACTILKRLRLDNITRERILLLIKYHDTQILPEKKSVKRLMGKIGPEAFFELLQLKSADMRAQKGDEQDPRLALLTTLQTIAGDIISEGEAFSLKDLALNGQDLLALGVARGPRIGLILKEVLDLVIDGRLPNEAESLLNYVRSQYR